jgi:hypothetical protein
VRCVSLVKAIALSSMPISLIRVYLVLNLPMNFHRTGCKRNQRSAKSNADALHRQHHQ